MSQGRVLLTTNEAARLLSEEVRRHIENRQHEEEDMPAMPPEIAAIAEKVKKLGPNPLKRADR
jgi:DNA primase large subunit